jgi:hypothetical protein
MMEESQLSDSEIWVSEKTQLPKQGKGRHMGVCTWQTGWR